MSVKDNYPNLRPSLALNFAQTKTLDPRITFSRASTGTYYDGVTHAKAEENLLTNSEDISGSGWFGAFLRTENATTAPDGTTTADLAYPSVTSTSYRYQDLGFSGVEAVGSMYLKSSGFQWARLQFSTGARCWFDLTNGLVGTADTGITGSIVSVGNGWYRCAIYSASTPAGFFGFSMSDSDGVATHTANGTDGIYVWGAQFEQRDSLTAYTATTTQPITNYIPVLQSAAAGEARFDHDPVTGESKGLLIEGQRTNLLTYSEDFSDAAWTKNNSSIDSNVIVAPDGTLTGDKTILDDGVSSSTTDWLERSVSSAIPTGGIYTVTVFAKKAEAEQLFIAFRNRANIVDRTAATFNLSTGVVSNSEAESSSMVDVGNGWYRCVAVIDFVSGGTTPRIYLGGYDLTTGDGYSGIFIWGAQLEAGAFSTSYIKTTSAQATRSADSASMTGTNFSEWYRQDEGTVYVEEDAFDGTNAIYSWTISDGTNDDRIGSYLSGNLARMFCEVNNVIQVNDSHLNSFTDNTFFKHIVAYKLNDFAHSVDGETAETDTAGLVPNVCDRLNIGASALSADHLNGHIKRLAYYPLRLTNAQLQALTEG